MYRKKGLSILIIVLIAMLIVACGSKTTAPVNQNNETTQVESGETVDSEIVEETEVTQPLATVDLNWRTRPANDAEQATYQDINDRINQKLENVNLSYDPAPYAGYEDKLLTELSAGTAPDIIWIPGATFSSYASKGVLVDLMPLIEADPDIAVEDFFPVVMDEITHDGKVFGLPRDVGTMVVYYNVDLFEAAGLKTPKELQAEGNWNWDTMYEAALALTTNTDNAEEITWGLDIPFWWPTYLSIIMQGGGSLFNEDRTACALDTEATTVALEYLYKIYNGDGNNPAVAPSPGSETDAASLFLGGKIAMHWDGRWSTPAVRTSEMNWDVVELPEGPAGPSNFAFWGAYVITSGTEDVDAAFEVLKELVSPETQNSIIELGTIMPSIVAPEALEAFKASTPPENNAAFLNPMEYAIPEQSPWNINMNTLLWAILHPETQRVMVGEITPEEYTQSICEQINPLFEN